MEPLLTLTYDSTHYYLIDCPGGKLLVDAGMPGTLPKFKAQLKTYRLDFLAIRYVMFTHNHPDHAGIIQEIKKASSAKLLIQETQVAHLPELRAFYEKKDKSGYVPIRIEKGDIVLQTPNHSVLNDLGIPGEVIETPGHSADSVSLVLDSGRAFIGDLSPFPSIDPVRDAQWAASWKTLIDRGVQLFYPAHADPMPVERIKQILSGSDAIGS